MKTTYQICVVHGDGIGPEVGKAALRVLEAAFGESIPLRFNEYLAGAQHFLETGESFPKETFEACRAADAILHGAAGMPGVVHPDGTEAGLDFTLMEGRIPSPTSSCERTVRACMPREPQERCFATRSPSTPSCRPERASNGSYDSPSTSRGHGMVLHAMGAVASPAATKPIYSAATPSSAAHSMKSPFNIPTSRPSTS